MSDYKVTIGMEIHVELATNAKMFSGAPNGLGEEDHPNVSIDEVVTAQPGALVVPNKQAIAYVQMAGLALGCDIAKESKFDRKHYFYPDLPKGYQISQYDQPLCGTGGSLEITLEDGSTKKIGITRIHMEEDTGKNTHKGNSTYVDLNRAGVPLMELVSEPDISSAQEARIFCQNLQQVFRYIGISAADIEKGQMRCEVNLSLYKEGEDPLSGTKVEVKNIGSFKSVERTVLYEIQRQSEVLDEGGQIVQETRGWDDTAGKTSSQRSKENANDYRYFPEPDIPPMTFSDLYIEDLRRSLPELPTQKYERFEKQYGIRKENLDVITADKEFANYFENIISEIKEKIVAKEVESEEKKLTQLAANYLVSEVQRLLAQSSTPITQIKITAEDYAELICLVGDGMINSSAAQTVLAEMFATGEDPGRIIDANNLAQDNDQDALLTIVQKIIDNNPESVDDFKAGKDNAIKFLMGQVMKETGGKANPQLATKLLKEVLAK